MTRTQKIGSWLLGGCVALAFAMRQRLAFGVKGVYLNGIITPELVPLRILVWIANKTIGSVLVRSVSGVLYCEGEVVASISQPIMKRIPSNRYVEQDILVDLHVQESLQALMANINSGNINVSHNSASIQIQQVGIIAQCCLQGFLAKGIYHLQIG